MDKEAPLVKLNQSPGMNYLDVSVLDFSAGMKFTPAKRFEFQFQVKAGGGEKLREKFEKAAEAEMPVEIEVFTPAGMTERVRIVGLASAKPDPKQPYPADVMTAEVDLTDDQILMFAPLDPSSDFGY